MRRHPGRSDPSRWWMGHGAALGVTGGLSWLGDGWGYLALYGLVLATFGVVTASGWAAVRRSSGRPASRDFVLRFAWSFARAEMTLASTVVLTAGIARGMEGPIGPFPGGPFEGQPSSEPWPENLALPGHGLQLQIPATPPYTINTHGFMLDGCLHVGADFVLPFKRWVHVLDRDDRVIVRIGERLFLRRAARVTDPGESRRVLEQVSEIRGVEPDDWLTEVWFFRLGCDP